MNALEEFVKEFKPLAKIAFLLWIFDSGGSKCQQTTF